MKIWTDYIHILTALLVITNPIGALPVFITLTRDQTLAARRNTTRITATAVAIVLVVSMFLGEPLLRFFGIGLPSFRVGGGILIMLMAIPMLAGPGAISTTIVYAHQARSGWDIAFLLFAALLVAGSVWAVLSLAQPIANRLGRYGISVATRVMGLILAAVAVEFIAGGLIQLVPSLG